MDRHPMEGHNNHTIVYLVYKVVEAPARGLFIAPRRNMPMLASFTHFTPRLLLHSDLHVSTLNSAKLCTIPQQSTQ